MRTALGIGWALLWWLGPALSAPVVQPLVGTPPAAAGALGPGCPTLEQGEFVRFFCLAVEAGKTYTLRVETEDFAARLLVGLREGPVSEAAAKRPGDSLELTFTPTKSGQLLLALTSLVAGQKGAFRVAASLPSTPPPVAQPAATPAAPPKSGHAAPAKVPRPPPVPKFEGTKTLDLSQLGTPLPVPKPLPATVKNPGVLAETLYQMNYLCVTVGGWSEVQEENWLYPKPGDKTHSSPRHFYTDADNQFWDPGEARDYTVPLQWNGNVFSLSHRRNLDDRGSLEMLDVTGTVSPDGDRVEWVSLREYVQEAYWDEQAKQSLLRRRLWQMITLVDLPLRNLHYRPESDDPAKRFLTMQERLKLAGGGLMRERLLNEGFHYGYDNARDAGAHVLDLGYLQQDPAVKGAAYIEADRIHAVRYLATNWAHPDGADARVSFERRKNVR